MYAFDCAIYCCRGTDLEELAMCDYGTHRKSMHLKVGSRRSGTHGYAIYESVESRAMHT